MVAFYIMLARTVGRFFTVLRMNFPVMLIAEDICGRWLGLCRYAGIGRSYFVECGLRNAESCQRVICGKLCAERSANYHLSLFRIPQLKNSAFPRIAKLPFARIAQLMRSQSIATSGITRCLPSIFFVARLPKIRVVFYNFY